MESESNSTSRREMPPAETFIAAIRDQIACGYGVVPLIGAGTSAPSGIPIVRELCEYLNRCIAMALRLDPYKRMRWMPGDDWPEFENLMLWSADLTASPLAYLIGELERRSTKDAGDRNIHVYQEGIGAMADWKTALLFLCRLRLDGERYWLGAPQYEMVDSFFRSVIAGKSPTLVHSMLAQLAVPLRVQTIFTTNFDNLLEIAFSEARLDLEVFGVHMHTAIPPHSLTQRKRALIKLHGTNYGLRADYSLNAMPSEDDIKAFVEALTSPRQESSEGRSPISKATPKSIVAGETLVTRNHLFVLGVSGADLRVTKLIEGALKRITDRNFRIFWICYSKRDEDEVTALRDRLCSSRLCDKATFVILQHTYSGVFLLQLYQHLTFSLPATGLIFPSPPFLPFPAAPDPKACESPRFASETKRLKDEILKMIADDGPGHSFLAFSSSPTKRENNPDKVSGISSIASHVFSELSQGPHQALWLDLDDVGDVDEMFEQILHAISRKSGVAHWMPVVLDRFNRGHAPDIAQYTLQGQRKWILFLQAREGAGVNIERSDLRTPIQQPTAKKNGWIDNTVREDRASRGKGKRLRSPANGKALAGLLKELTGASCPNLSIVLLCWSTDEVKKHFTFGQTLTLKDSFDDIKLEHCAEAALAFVELSNGGDLISSEELDTRRRFLHSLCRMKRSRYPAVFWGWTFRGNNDRNEGSSQAHHYHERAEEWLSHLELHGVIRRKPGGYVWMHSLLRSMIIDRMREALSRTTIPKTVGKESYPCDAFKATDHDIQHGLAEWYENHFISSNDPMFAFESALHRCEGAAVALAIAQSNKPLCEQYIHHAIHALDCATKTIVASRDRALSSGFTRTICRKLLDLRERCTSVFTRHAIPDNGETPSLQETLHESATSLLEASLELSRDIAREISELAVMAERNDEIVCITHNASRRLPPPAADDTFLLQVGEPKHTGARRSVARKDAILPYKHTTRILRVFRHEIALGTACRSYGFAQQCFGHIGRLIGFDAKLLKGADTATVLHESFEWVCKNQQRLGAETLGEFHRSICSYMQLLLCRRQLELACATRDDLPRRKADGEDYLKLALHCYWCAGEIMRRLPGIPHAKLCHQKQILKTRFAIACSGVRDFEQAHRRLDEAEACLTQCDPGLTGMEHGIIALHRVEVLAQQILYKPALSPTSSHDECSALGDWRQTLLALLAREAAASPEFLCVVRRKYFKKGAHADEFRTYRALLTDARQHLMAAERDLSVNRKNVWWVSWMSELGLKLIEIEMCLLCSDETGDGNIPRHYTLRLPLNFESRADVLLLNAQRMIRHDVFQLARVTEAYLRIVAMFLLVIKGTPSFAKHDMQLVRAMVDKSRTAVRTLRDTHEKRLALANENALPSLDPDVAAYSTYVSKTIGDSYVEIFDKWVAEL